MGPALPWYVQTWNPQIDINYIEVYLKILFYHWTNIETYSAFVSSNRPEDTNFIS